MSEKYEKIYSANAEKSKKYGGQRFLGITPKGKEVWSRMEFDRSSKVLDLNLGKGFKDLYDEQAFLSPVRIQIKLSQTKPKNLQHQFKIIKKKTSNKCRKK